MLNVRGLSYIQEIVLVAAFLGGELNSKIKDLRLDEAVCAEKERKKPMAATGEDEDDDESSPPPGDDLEQQPSFNSIGDFDADEDDCQTDATTVRASNVMKLSTSANMDNSNNNKDNHDGLGEALLLCEQVKQ
jgi:hypothetical protein